MASHAPPFLSPDGGPSSWRAGGTATKVTLRRLDPSYLRRPLGREKPAGSSSREAASPDPARASGSHRHNLPLAETSCHLEMLRGARRTVLNFPSPFLGENWTQRIKFPFCCLIWRLQFPPLLLLGVTCHAVVGSLWRPSLQGNANLLHLSRNRSNPEQGYCERGARLVSSLDFWTLSSENLIGISWSSLAVLLTSGCVSPARGCTELCGVISYLIMLKLLVNSPGDTGEWTRLIPRRVRKSFP